MVGLNKLQRVFTPPKSNTTFSEGHKSKGILDDYAERQVVDSKEYSGNMMFVGGGLVYGEIYTEDNTGQQELTTSMALITNFDTNGLSNQTTPDQANNKITIKKKGVYKVCASISVESVTGGGAFDIEIDVFWNGTTQPQLHAHRSMSGGGGDIGSIAITGFIDVTSVPTDIDLRALASATKTVIFEDMNLNALMIGGT